MKEDSPVPPDIDGQPSTSATTNTGLPGPSSSARHVGRIQPSPGSLSTDVPAPTIASTNINSASTRQDSNGLERASTSPTTGPHAARHENGTFPRFPQGSDGRSVSALSSNNLSSVTSPQDERQGPVLDTKEHQLDTFNRQNTDEITNGSHVSDNINPPRKRTFMQEARRTFWLVATHSWMNLLLVFVPVGIVVANLKGINGGIVFAMNCIAVVPLAGLLSHATESVASKMGDALGALLNITFGNAVELIIFIIALSKNEIRIVQASLLGSILANLLLILGMGFFLGGLRFREQVYNSTVTQMSACLLSLSVISLVLPTAFHASFKDDNLANERSLKISRGTSVILLLVYILYLLFQLKSHAYMYESTPQHIVDAEAIPGPAAGWLNSSSSDESSSSSSDSDDSSRSRDTVRKRMRKVLRPRRRTKSSTASQDGYDKDGRSSSIGTNNTSPQDEAGHSSTSLTKPPFFPGIPSVDNVEEVIEGDAEPSKHGKARRHRKHRHSSKTRHKFSRHHGDSLPGDGQPADNGASSAQNNNNETKRVDFALPKDATPATGGDQVPPLTGDTAAQDQASTKRPAFQALRTISVRNFAPTVFVQKPDPADLYPAPAPGPVPRVRYGIRRTNSLPDRLSQPQQFIRAPGGFFPAQVPLTTFRTGTVPSAADPEIDDDGHLTKWAAIILLLITTGLVAVCAEFLVDSIKDVTSESSSVGEIFIGLIILPIVGNAAEHVTAITVAMKNKMDLAIGVAVGSSIQIALFVTPLIVILGWIMNREMTLYFTLFETVCLFVSTFIVNFLVLDGRSNYLEGALLCAVYVIIAVVAFFYPSPAEASSWGS